MISRATSRVQVALLGAVCALGCAARAPLEAETAVATPEGSPPVAAASDSPVAAPTAAAAVLEPGETEVRFLGPAQRWIPVVTHVTQRFSTRHFIPPGSGQNRLGGLGVSRRGTVTTPQPMWFSPDGRQVAFRRVTAGGEEMVVNGERHPAYEKVQLSETGGAWSGDSKHFAYWGLRRSDGTWVLVVDGVESGVDGRAHPRGDTLTPRGGPELSANGRVAAVASVVTSSVPRHRREDVLWIDGKAHTRLGRVDAGPRWDPKGERVALALSRGSVWIDGWERGGYGRILKDGFGWSDRGEMRFRTQLRNNRSLLVLGERELEVEATVVGDVQQRGRKKIAYVMRAGNQHHLIYRDRMQATHDKIVGLQFTPDGRTLVYVAEDGGASRVVVLERGKSAELQMVANGTKVQMRADGQCLAYMAGTRKFRAASSIQVVGVPGASSKCDSHVYEPYIDVGQPVFVGERVAFLAIEADKPDDAVLQLGKRSIRVGHLPRWMLGVAVTEDGRISHIAERDGMLYHVVRKPDDRRTVAKLVDGIDPVAPRAKVRGKVLGRYTDSWSEVHPSHSSQRVAWITQDPNAKGARFTLFLDAKPVAEMPELPRVRMSEAGHLLAAFGNKRGEMMVSIDGGEPVVTRARRETIEFIGGGPNWMGMEQRVLPKPEHGSRYTWFLIRSSGDDIALGPRKPFHVSFSPDGKRLAVIGTNHADSRRPHELQVDGKLVMKLYAQKDAFKWSDDSRHYMVVGKLPKGATRAYSLLSSVVVDGKVVATDKVITPVGFDGGGKPVYLASNVNRPKRPVDLGVGAQRFPVTFHGPHGTPPAANRYALNPHKPGVAYISEDLETIYVNGHPLRSALKGACCLTWDTTGTTVAYLASVADATGVYVGNKLVHAHDWVDRESLRFLPSGELVYVTEKKDDTGKRLPLVVAGDDTFGPYAELDVESVQIGPAGELAWFARTGIQWELFVNGKSRARFVDPLPGAKPHWDNNGKLRALVLTNHDLLSLEL